MRELETIMEYNDAGVTLWSLRYPGAFARGETADAAARKLPAACRRYRLWAKLPTEADAAVRNNAATSSRERPFFSNAFMFILRSVSFLLYRPFPFPTIGE